MTSNFDIENERGLALSARIDWPESPPRAFAVFAHCFTCSRNLKATRQVIRGLSQQGIATLSFDFTGLGSSEGDFSETNFSTNVSDLLDAAAYLEEAHQAPSLLVGHSLGGAAVLHAAHQLPSVKAVATIGAPFNPSHVKHLFAHARHEIHADGEAKVQLGGRHFTIQSQLLEDLDTQDTTSCIASLGRALLVLHAPLDETVGVENATRIFGAAKHPKSFVSLHEADHLMSRAEDARYAGEVIGAWATRYIA